MRALHRAVATRKDGGVWTIRYGTYSIEGFGANRAKDRELVRKPDWFVVLPKDVWDLGDEKHAPASEVAGIRQDSRGRIWTATLVPSKDWKAARGKMVVESDGSGGKVNNYPKADLGAMYDTMLEVIDPSTGRVITSKRLRAWARYILDDDHVAGCRYAEGGAGAPWVEIWQVKLKGL
jgi:hypothetical protein